MGGSPESRGKAATVFVEKQSMLVLPVAMKGACLSLKRIGQDTSPQ